MKSVKAEDDGWAARRSKASEIRQRENAKSGKATLTRGRTEVRAAVSASPSVKGKSLRNRRLFEKNTVNAAFRRVLIFHFRTAFFTIDFLGYRIFSGRRF